MTLARVWPTLQRRWQTYSSSFGAVDVVRDSLSAFLESRINGYVAAGHGDKTAIVCGVSTRSVSYSELIPRIRSAAARMASERGIGASDTVLLHAPNCPEYPIAFHAALRLGGVVSTANPLYTSEELSHQVRDAKPKHIITLEPFKDTVLKAVELAGAAETSVSCLGSSECPVALCGTPFVDHNPDLADANLGGNRVAVLPYSSGTTGMPKGVMLTHANVATNILQSELLFSKHATNAADVTFDSSRPSSDVILGLLPFFHIYGMNTILHYALAQGATLVSLPKFEPESFLQTLVGTDHSPAPTLAFLVPPLILFLSHYPQPVKTALRAICSGAAPLDAALQVAVRNKLGVDVFQGYGMTETSPVTHGDMIGTPGAVGQLAPSTECRIVRKRRREEIVPAQEADDDPLRDVYVDVQPGEQGELLIRGPQVCLGYLGRDDETAQTLLPGGWLRTGDVAIVEHRQDVGHTFYVVDRVKELIKVKGLQVSPAELEGFLLQHHDLDDSCVLPQPDKRSGELPHAFVVAKAGAERDAKSVADFVNAKVAPHKRLAPDRITFIDAIPKSASGKILRRNLKQTLHDILAKRAVGEA